MKKHIILGIVVGILIILFLSRKIITIPFETPDRGLINVVGVLVILLVSVLVNYLLYKLKKYRKQK